MKSINFVKHIAKHINDKICVHQNLSGLWLQIHSNSIMSPPHPPQVHALGIIWQYKLPTKLLLSFIKIFSCCESVWPFSDRFLHQKFLCLASYGKFYRPYHTASISRVCISMLIPKRHIKCKFYTAFSGIYYSLYSNKQMWTFN